MGKWYLSPQLLRVGMSLGKKGWQRDQCMYVGLEGRVGGAERSPAGLEQSGGHGRGGGRGRQRRWQRQADHLEHLFFLLLRAGDSSRQ